MNKALLLNKLKEVNDVLSRLALDQQLFESEPIRAALTLNNIVTDLERELEDRGANRELKNELDRIDHLNNALDKVYGAFEPSEEDRGIDEWEKVERAIDEEKERQVEEDQNKESA